MQGRNRKEIGLKIVLIASTGLTLTVSAQAMAQLSSTQPERAYETFRQAVLDGQVQLLAPQQVTGPNDELQQFSDAFNQRFNDVGGKT